MEASIRFHINANPDTVCPLLAARLVIATCIIQRGCVCPFQMSNGLDAFAYCCVGGTKKFHHVYHPKVLKVEGVVPTQLIVGVDPTQLIVGVENDILVSVGSQRLVMVHAELFIFLMWIRDA